jgi:hypothetical protein
MKLEVILSPHPDPLLRGEGRAEVQGRIFSFPLLKLRRLKKEREERKYKGVSPNILL